SSSSTPPKSRPKCTLRNRSPTEALDLRRDVAREAYDAGPRTGPARTLQAYAALSCTIRDFLPPRPGGRATEEFTPPVVPRKLFEQLGATYVKLGQVVTSSPSLFPKEYEYQMCLDSTSLRVRGLQAPRVGEHCAVSLRQAEDGGGGGGHQGPEAGHRRAKADLLNFVYIASHVVEFLQPDFERTSQSEASNI
ncbi:LOW QUALITY PROTEIN: hypothetical protein ACHAWF_000724, partial [Thalassiosira exigua]